ncbi:MAG: GNAT family N-acetyltransferase [bacterium]
MIDAKIRKYTPEDRDAVRRICFETGFGGDTIEPYFDDVELFGDILTMYYTDREPESAWIVEAGGEAVGYFLGCLDTARQSEITNREIYPAILRNIARGKYRIGRKTQGYIGRSIGALMSGELKHPPLSLYPAHLHINLLPGYRRGGIGGRLMDIYFRYLRKNGVPGLHLGTSTLHRRGIPFYDKLGFRQYVRARSALWENLIDTDVYNIIYVKRLVKTPPNKPGGAT